MGRGKRRGQGRAVLGGEPWLGSAPRLPAWPEADWCWCDSGRSAFRWLLRSLPGSPVLLPAYGCPSLPEAALAERRAIGWYHVDERLQPRWQDIPPGPAILVLVHPFGRLLSRVQVADLRRRRPELMLVEDASHTLANAASRRWLGPPYSEGVFASLRKALPLPGGGVVCRWDRRLPSPPPNPQDPVVTARLRARRARSVAGAQRWIERAEMLLAARAEPLAADVRLLGAARRLRRSDGRRWRLAARRNWRLLHERLTGVAGWREVVQELPPGVCPPGFPLRLPERTVLALRLARAGILTLHHWPIATPARAVATLQERIWAGTTLTLPCDGRYDRGTMRRLAQAVRRQAPMAD